MSRFPEIAVSEQVLERARAGDASAWRSLYDACASPVYTLIRRMVGQPAVAEELMQDAFVELLRQLHRYSGAGSFTGWVRSIAVSKALMYLRSPACQWARLAAHLGTAEPPQPAAVAPDELEGAQLEQALNALPAATRSVVWLHDVEGYTHEEIAQLFGKTSSFSKSQLARGHERLRAALEPAVEAGVCTTL